MKKIFTILTTVEESTRLEKVLNQFRIGLNDWDKTKVFDVQGNRVVNYTIVCEENVFVSITNAMNAARFY